MCLDKINTKKSPSRERERVKSNRPKYRIFFVAIFVVLFLAVFSVKAQNQNNDNQDDFEEVLSQFYKDQIPPSFFTPPNIAETEIIGDSARLALLPPPPPPMPPAPSFLSKVFSPIFKSAGKIKDGYLSIGDEILSLIDSQSYNRSAVLSALPADLPAGEAGEAGEEEEAGVAAVQDQSPFLLSFDIPPIQNTGTQAAALTETPTESAGASGQEEQLMNFLKSRLALLDDQVKNIERSGLVFSASAPAANADKIKKELEAGVTKEYLEEKLNNLNTSLLNQINNLSSNTSRQTSAAFSAISLTNKIDSLSGTRLSNITVSGVSGLTDADIPDTLTASNYLPLVGGTLTGSLAGTNLTLSGDLTVLGAQTLSGAITIPYFSATSTAQASTIDYRLGIGTTSPYRQLSVGNNAVFGGDVIASYFTATSTTASTFPYASSTALTVSGNSYLGTVSSGTWNGSLLTVPYGGTGWAAIQSGSIPYGNGSSALSTTTAATAGYVLAYLNGIPTWTATTTLSDITGTLAISKGGTGQTSFGQGWLHSDGTTFTASTSPTVAYLTATSTTATSTLTDLNFPINSNIFYGGQRFLTASTTSAGNLTIGYQSATGLDANGGLYNTGVGYQALGNATSTGYNTALGYQALKGSATISNTGYNTAVGYRALFSNTTGNYNTANGYQSLYSNTTQDRNTALGYRSLYSNTTGYQNTANGVDSLFSNTTGASNVGFGYRSGYGDSTTQDQRSVIDNYATFIGYQASRSESVASTFALTNITAIGKNARVGASNSIVLGGTGSDAINVAIGTTSPWAKLSIQNTYGSQSPLFDIASSTNASGSATSSIFRVNADGNVGIGTTSPYAKLSVVGPVVAEYFHATSTTATSTFAGGLAVETSGLVYDYSTNRVGIGMANPGVSLDVIGDMRAGSGVYGSNAYFLTYRGNGNTNVGFYSNSGYDLIFNPGGTERLRMTNSGNVGIGTTSPYAKLSVVGETVAEYFTATSTTATSTFAGGMNVAGTAGLTVLQNGNVGVGLATPSTKLHIRDGSSGQTFSSGSVSGLIIENNGSANNYYALQIATLAGKIFSVTNNGNVGIGTTSPMSLFSVSGNATVWNGATQADVKVYNGAVCADNNGSAKCQAALTAGTVYGDSSTFTASDIAENYPVADPSIEAGDIVMAASDISGGEKSKRDGDKSKLEGMYKEESGAMKDILAGSVAKASKDNAASVIGIISTKPGVLLGDITGLNLESSFKPVALSGRVPLKVSSEGGAIKAGDRITISSVDGVGMKAKDEDASVAVALEPFNGGTSVVGKIMAFVKFGSARLDPKISKIATGEIGLADGWAIDQAAGNIKPSYSIDMNGYDIINVRKVIGAANWSIDENGVLSVKEVRTEKLCVGEVCVTEEQFKKVFGQPEPTSHVGSGGSSSSASVSSQSSSLNSSSSSSSSLDGSSSSAASSISSASSSESSSLSSSSETVPSSSSSFETGSSGASSETVSSASAEEAGSSSEAGI